MRGKGQTGKRRLLVIMAACLFFVTAVWPMQTYAADAKILSTIVYDGSIYIYIRGISQIQPDSVIQIGNEQCDAQQISTAPLASLTPSMRTLVLVDNSQSIPDNNHADIQEILEGITAGVAENEQIRIATFSDTVTYLCDYTSDQKTLNNAAGAISYFDQESYLSDVLHNAISEFKAENACVYTRVLIFSDGADDKSIGYPNDEVRSYIEKNAYPVYTIGIPKKNNSSQLETMFSFSRAAKSEYFLLDGSTSNADIVSALLQDQNSICLKITPEEHLKDGSNKSILLKLNTPEGMVELTTSADMPFGEGAAAEPASEQQSEPESLPTIAPHTEPETESAEKDKGGISTIILIVIIVSGVLVAALVILAVVLLGKRKKPAEQQSQQSSQLPVKPSDLVTIIGSVPMHSDPEPLWSNYVLVIKNLDDPRITFKVPIRDVVHIGRIDKDITIDDNEVSRTHCDIILRGDLLYLKDCNSRNGTYYQNVRIYDETPIVEGGVIRIGKYRYQVELEKQ